GIWPKEIKKDWLGEQVEMANYVKEALREANVPMSVAAIKYILANPDVSSIIPGSANPAHVKINIEALNAPALSPQTLKLLKELWVTGKIHGTYNGSI
ncbi:MAG: aldo/keto reductase, partial [bacterium]|nr:aldo/keto reductase [bacterium]